MSSISTYESTGIKRKTAQRVDFSFVVSDKGLHGCCAEVLKAVQATKLSIISTVLQISSMTEEISMMLLNKLRKILIAK